MHSVLEVKDAMDETGRSPDLPGRDSLCAIRDHFGWNVGIVHKSKPPIRVDEERCSPLEVGLFHPKVVVKPIVRGDGIEGAKTSLCAVCGAIEKGVDESSLSRVGDGKGGPAAVLVGEEDGVYRAEISVECLSDVWHGQSGQRRHHRPKHPAVRHVTLP